MYATHFDLNGRLFAPGIAQDDALFVDEREEDAGLPAAVALSAPDSVLVLLGPPGVGKTAFAANALRTSTGGMRCAVAWIGTPPASPHELLELLLAEFGFEPYRQSRAERLQTWRQFLVELGATATRVFVALERAHDFELPVLSALDALTTADPNACPGASLVLMGTDELASRLEEPSLEPLRQRVRLVRRLAPLDASGVDRYLRHAAARAGGTFERLFTADAVTAIARHSRGIPRIVNHLSEGALALATLRGTALVDAAIVTIIAAERAGSTLPARPHAMSSARTARQALMRSETAARQPVTRSAPRALEDDIPVLTEYVDGTRDGDGELHPLEGAATMTLLGDDLDGLSAEIAAEMLAADSDAADGGLDTDANEGSASEAGLASETGPTRASNAGAGAGDADDGRPRGKPRRRAAG